MTEKGFLVLESGEVFSGRWWGGQNRAGEVVFNTTHSGYEEVASDPSYFSQIVVMTAPMQGNYGAHPQVMESKQYWIEGFVSLQIQNSERDHLWKNRLIDSGIPVFSEVETRRLVKILRSTGTQWGALVQAQTMQEAQQMSRELIANKKNIEKDWVHIVSRKEKQIRAGKNMVGPRVAVLDFGSKENILREILELSSEVCIFPARSSYEEILAYKPQGVLLTNGPGDPSEVQGVVKVLRELVGKIPIFGICMGHQLLALSLGARTYKLRFGHRGSNHPVRDDLLKKVYMTSHNHGYAVEESTLPKNVRVSQRNLNDQTVSGIYSSELKILGIQYHPESCPGPHEARELFRYFTEVMI